MRILTTLLASTAMLASAPAFAAEPAAETAGDAGMAMAAEAAPEAADTNEIVVFGAGQTRQVQEVSGKDLAVLAAGTSPLKAIEKLPSVNFQSADPFGSYEWSTRITIRGFNQNQLGFTLDGIPLGDMTYGNHNGLHISRAITSENIGVTRVSQGSGSITTQSTNNLGGTLEFLSIDPKDALGYDVNATYGSENTWRGFARIGLGEATGSRIFASVMYSKADKWKGDGEQKQLMVNSKAIVPLGATVFDGYFSYSDRAEQDYQDLSLEQINRLGYDWDNFGPSNYALALNVADIANNIDSFNNSTGAPGADGLSDQTGLAPSNPAAGKVFPGNIKSVDDAYYDASGLRKDTLAAVGVTAPVGPLTFKLKGYYHENDGQGTWGTPYVGSPSGVPMAVRTTEYDLKRTGTFGSLSGQFAFNALTVGGWYENNDFGQARRFYGYESRSNPGRDHLRFMTNPFFTQWDIRFNTDTYQYYVQDEMDFGPLKVNLGWKGFQVDVKASAAVQGGRTIGNIRTRDWFQPHAGVNYRLGNGVELFAGFTEVTRAFVGSTTTGIFSSSQAGFDKIKGTIKPEQSDTYEGGLRYNTGAFNAVLAGYYVDFRNRLLAIPTSVGIVGAVNALQNVGNVRAIGLEAAGEYKLTPALSLFASYSYNDTTYRDDVVDGNGKVYAIAGRTVVDTPRHLAHGEVAYDDKALFGRIGVNYMSKRYFTYGNDQSVPGRVIVDASLGYRFDVGLRKPVEVQVNGVNLFDKKYVSTIGSNGFGFSGDNQTLLAGAPRQVFVSLKTGF